MQTEIAFARRTDPATSHAAAASVTDLRGSQEDVLKVLRFFGPTTDEELVARYEHEQLGGKMGVRPQSESGIRTRRAELVTRGLVADTGIRVKVKSGNKATVWRAVSERKR